MVSSTLKFIWMRALPFWVNAGVSLGALLSIFAIVNFISYKQYFRVDFTRGGIYSLSDQSLKVLEELDRKSEEIGDKLEIIAFFREGEAGRLRDLLETYKYKSSSVKYRFVDPDKNPTETVKYGIKSYGTIVVKFGARTIKISESTENAITNAIIKVTRATSPRICFTEGHGERDIDSVTDKIALGSFKKALEDEGYDVGKVRLWEEDALAGCEVVVVAAPLRRFADAEIQALDEFLRVGGRTMFLLEPARETKLEGLLRRWGIGLDERVVVDPTSRLFGGSPAMPVIIEYSKVHEITKDFNMATFLYLARRVFKSDGVEGIDVTEIAKTSPKSWAERRWKAGKVSPDEEDIKGPVSVAVAVEGLPGVKGEVTYGTMEEPREVKARLVVVGDSDFISNQLIELSGNKDFALNSINWLAERGELISIRPKERKGGRIVMTPKQGKAMFLIAVIGVPLAMFIGAILTFLRKRKL